MQVTAMRREFRFNGVRLPDPNPKLDVEQVREIYSTQYPEIATASVNGPESAGERLIYHFERAIGSKG